MKSIKLLSAVISVIALFCLAACGNESKKDDKTTDASSVNSVSSEAVSSSEYSASSEEEKAETKEEWKIEFEKSLKDEYGVSPYEYKDLGDGIYEVYVEKNGSIISFVTVDSKTGNYHG